MLGEELRHLITWSVIDGCIAQIVAVSSSFNNPVTHAGEIVDVALECWAIFVVTAVAGSFASFFMSGDQAPS